MLEDITPIQSSIRLVYSFTYEADRGDLAQRVGFEAVEDIQRDLYTDEMVSTVRQFLFGECNSDFDCRYFRPNLALQAVVERALGDIQIWTHGVLPKEHARSTKPIIARHLANFRLNDLYGVELLLGPLQTGILSITFDIVGEIKMADLKTLTYLCTSLDQSEHAVRLLKQSRGLTLNEENNNIQLVYQQANQFTELVGTLNRVENEELLFESYFTTIPRLISILLGETGSYSPRLFHYLVVKLDKDTDLVLSDDSELKRDLFGLVQAQELTHAGYIAGVIAPESLNLNKHHVVANSLYGSVHFISDQLNGKGNPIPFNAHRQGRILGRYFAYFLLPLIQRQIFESLLSRASDEIIASKTRQGAIVAGDLQLNLAQTLISSCFSVASGRDSLQWYYEMSKRSNRIEEMLQDAKRSITEVDAFLRMQIQTATLTSIRELAILNRSQQQTQGMTLGTIKTLAEKGESLQRLGHRFELFVLAVYTVELGHIIFVEAIHHNLVGTVAMITLASFGIFLVSMVHNRHSKDGNERHGYSLAISATIGAIVFAGIIWWVGSMGIGSKTEPTEAVSIPSDLPSRNQ